MNDPTEIVKAFASKERLEVYSLIVLAGENGLEYADLLQKFKSPGKSVGRLIELGLVTKDQESGSIRPVLSIYREILTDTSNVTRDTPEHLPDHLAGFYRGGRIAQIPTRTSARLELLRSLVSRLFDPEVKYSEAEVTSLLGAEGDDPATLRRYLVDEGLLERRPDGSEYRVSIAG